MRVFSLSRCTIQGLAIFLFAYVSLAYGSDAVKGVAHHESLKTRIFGLVERIEEIDLHRCLNRKHVGDVPGNLVLIEDRIDYNPVFIFGWHRDALFCRKGFKNLFRADCEESSDRFDKKRPSGIVEQPERYPHLHFTRMVEYLSPRPAQLVILPVVFDAPFSNVQPLSELRLLNLDATPHGFGGVGGSLCLPANENQRRDAQKAKPPFGRLPPWWRFCLGVSCVWVGCFVIFRGRGWRSFLVALLLGEAGTILFLTGTMAHPQSHNSDHRHTLQHDVKIVPHKYLDRL